MPIFVFDQIQDTFTFLNKDDISSSSRNEHPVHPIQSVLAQYETTEWAMLTIVIKDSLSREFLIEDDLQNYAIFKRYIRVGDYLQTAL